jgi:hypothetical protein
MKDWFEWNGVRCTDHGIYVLEQPPPTIPKERVTYTDIPGRPGSLTTLEGDDVYEDVTLTAKCMVADPDVIPVLAGWLKGGGTVTFGDNIRRMREAGTVIYLERPLAELSQKNRPLSQAKGVETLFAQRKPLYETAAHLTVAVQSTPDQTVDAILQQLGEAKE